ncbi:MAG: DUF1849 family protein [Beijerinckiaceae bacterium]|nr:DUF1849 family protein [Beijerinckiaceae bacterium]
MPIRLALPFLMITLVTPAAAQAPVMASYRAVYDLALAPNAGGSGIESGRGRIVLEFTGSACEGYALNFRQVTELSGGEIGRKLSDTRSTTFEDGDAGSFRFKSESRQGPGPAEATDGVAERGKENILVTMKKPKASKVNIPLDTAFPTQHLRELVEKARAGTGTFARRVYDGSDESKIAYDTFAVIGAKKSGTDGLEPDIVKAGWAQVPRWPVSISFFEPGKTDEPAYIVSYEMFDNGFGRAIKLDYGTFAFLGTLTKLEPIESKPCKK